MENLQLLPAVDVQGGQAVQLVQGIAGSQKEFGDPLAAALRWQDGGAEWLHLVDLDAAFGRGSNAELLRSIVGRLDMSVEISGGIRDDASLERALATGARLVNIGPGWPAGGERSRRRAIPVGAVPGPPASCGPTQSVVDGRAAKRSRDRRSPRGSR